MKKKTTKEIVEQIVELKQELELRKQQGRPHKVDVIDKLRKNAYLRERSFSYIADKLGTSYVSVRKQIAEAIKNKEIYVANVVRFYESETRKGSRNFMHDVTDREMIEWADSHREAAKEYRRKNKKKLKKYNTEYFKNYREKNREKLNKYQKLRYYADK